MCPPNQKYSIYNDTKHKKRSKSSPLKLIFKKYFCLINDLLSKLWLINYLSIDLLNNVNNQIIIWLF